MPNWEYEIIQLRSDTTFQKSLLNDQGKDGWELVFITATKGEATAYFKREVL